MGQQESALEAEGAVACVVVSGAGSSQVNGVYRAVGSPLEGGELLFRRADGYEIFRGRLLQSDPRVAQAAAAAVADGPGEGEGMSGVTAATAAAATAAAATHASVWYIGHPHLRTTHYSCLSATHLPAPHGWEVTAHGKYPLPVLSQKNVDAELFSRTEQQNAALSKGSLTMRWRPLPVPVRTGGGRPTTATDAEASEAGNEAYNMIRLRRKRQRDASSSVVASNTDPPKRKVLSDEMLQSLPQAFEERRARQEALIRASPPAVAMRPPTPVSDKRLDELADDFQQLASRIWKDDDFPTRFRSRLERMAADFDAKHNEDPLLHPPVISLPDPVEAAEQLREADLDDETLSEEILTAAVAHQSVLQLSVAGLVDSLVAQGHRMRAARVAAAETAREQSRKRQDEQQQQQQQAQHAQQLRHLRQIAQRQQQQQQQGGELGFAGDVVPGDTGTAILPMAPRPVSRVRTAPRTLFDFVSQQSFAALVRAHHSALFDEHSVNRRVHVPGAELSESRPDVVLFMIQVTLPNTFGGGSSMALPLGLEHLLDPNTPIAPVNTQHMTWDAAEAGLFSRHTTTSVSAAQQRRRAGSRGSGSSSNGGGFGAGRAAGAARAATATGAGGGAAPPTDPSERPPMSGSLGERHRYLRALTKACLGGKPVEKNVYIVRKEFNSILALHIALESILHNNDTQAPPLPDVYIVGEAQEKFRAVYAQGGSGVGSSAAAVAAKHEADAAMSAVTVAIERYLDGLVALMEIMQEQEQERTAAAAEAAAAAVRRREERALARREARREARRVERRAARLAAAAEAEDGDEGGEYEDGVADGEDTDEDDDDDVYDDEDDEDGSSVEHDGLGSRNNSVDSAGTPQSSDLVCAQLTAAIQSFLAGSDASEFGLYQDVPVVVGAALDSEAGSHGGSAIARASRSDDKQLQQQGYRCRGCAEKISAGFLGLDKNYAPCRFLGGLWCKKWCHSDQHRVIPHRVLQSLDYQPHRVCDIAASYLDSVSRYPMFCVGPDLLDMSPTLVRCRETRMKISYYVSLAVERSNSTATDTVFQAVADRVHVAFDCDLWSLDDIIGVLRGSLQSNLEALLQRLMIVA